MCSKKSVTEWYVHRVERTLQKMWSHFIKLQADDNDGLVLTYVELMTVLLIADQFSSLMGLLVNPPVFAGRPALHQLVFNKTSAVISKKGIAPILWSCTTICVNWTLLLTLCLQFTVCVWGNWWTIHKGIWLSNIPYSWFLVLAWEHGAK